VISHNPPPSLAFQMQPKVSPGGSVTVSLAPLPAPPRVIKCKTPPPLICHPHHPITCPNCPLQPLHMAHPKPSRRARFCDFCPNCPASCYQMQDPATADTSFTPPAPIAPCSHCTRCTQNRAVMLSLWFLPLLPAPPRVVECKTSPPLIRCPHHPITCPNCPLQPLHTVRPKPSRRTRFVVFAPTACPASRC
jgi:hypothetical protein